MEVNILEEREDGYKAFCVILSPDELATIEELRHGDSVEDTLADVISDGLVK